MGRFFTPEFFADPYATYDDLRVESVHWQEELGGWVLTGYADVATALADPRISRGRGPQEGDLLKRLLSRMMLFTDRLRTRGCARSPITRLRQDGDAERHHQDGARQVAERRAPAQLRGTYPPQPPTLN